MLQKGVVIMAKLRTANKQIKIKYSFEIYYEQNWWEQKPHSKIA